MTSAENPNQKLDGKDITAVINSSDAKPPHKDLYWQLGRGPNAQWVVRSGDWKLLGNPKDNRNPKSVGKDEKLFLANLKNDISEKSNVQKQNPEIVQRLRKVRQRYVAELDK